MKANQQPSLFEPDPNTIRDISVEQLLLDPQNARLAGRVDGGGQEELLRALWTEMDVAEVALSIAENGFFRSEPLFVIAENPHETDSRKHRYIAVEGNRRLAAVLLLRDRRLRDKLKATNLPDINEERKSGLDTLPAIVYPDRQSLWTSVGFRHINGIKPWDSFSKAKYIAEVTEKYNIALAEIAQRIGDRHATVKRLYRGYKILEQAESQVRFDREDIARNRFFFSHLYTAVDQPDFQQFLGIDSDTSLRPNPVPSERLGELEELMVWLYGNKSKEIEPIVRTQNPDLNTLREVISKPESLAALRSGYSLERSLAVAIGDKRRFREALTKAKVELQNAKGTVTTGYSGEDDLYDVIRDILAYGDSICDDMDMKRGILPAEPSERPTRRRRS